VSKPFGYYDWDFQQRRAYDDAQVERENAEYAAEEADRKRQRAEREAREAKEHAASEIHGWQASADELNDQLQSVQVAWGALRGFVRRKVTEIKALHDSLEQATNHQTRISLAALADEITEYLDGHS
jgi:hypothetical protein